MPYRFLADVVVVVHLAFIIFVATGAVLAWWWPRLLWAHVPALAWAIASVTVGLPCPLTPLEKGLRRLAGGGGYEGGFVDRYIEDVVYPDEYTAVLRTGVAVAVVAGYAVLLRAARQRGRAPTSGAGPPVATP